MSKPGRDQKVNEHEAVASGFDAESLRANGRHGDAEQGAADASAAPEGDWEQLKAKAAERDEFLSLLQHVKADYANYQKRVSRDLQAARQFAIQPLVADLLPVLDNLERALESSQAAGDGAGLVEGVNLICRQLRDVLAKHGLVPIEAAGQPFDPAFHEAVAQQPSGEHPDKTVLQELEKGYRLHDRVVRPAKVLISKREEGPGLGDGEKRG